ncbi:hypothetical protein GPEL0_01r4735 [Geoanaerobacter pelophilus]|uniref:Uncharacterized protein n=1 Tax=Geoanaerobacter pelophilus TaxID=60036 RepID=A0ABQ0MQ25_9BACT|nr:hypothetical protein GPEL0_01r4735 [Geoanaerobacter pelophilus]
MHPKILSAFYKEHFMCFVGDKDIDSTSPRTLNNLIARVTIEVSGAATVEPDKKVEQAQTNQGQLFDSSTENQ